MSQMNTPVRKEDFELYEGHDCGVITKDGFSGQREGLPDEPPKYYLCETPKKREWMP